MVAFTCANRPVVGSAAVIPAGALRNPWLGVGLLSSIGLLWSCGSGTEQLRKRAAFDFDCPEDQIEVYELDARTRGVRACGHRGTYIDTCGPSEAGDGCTWILNSDSTPAPGTPPTKPAPEPVAAASEAPPPPPPAGVAPADGSVARAIPVVGGIELRLGGRPAQNGSQALLMLGLTGSPPQSISAWEACTEALAIADDRTFPIQSLKIGKQGYGSAALLTGRLRVGELIHLAKAERDSAIIVCGQRNEIEPSGRRVLLMFLRDFKQAALKSGTWDPSLPSDTAAPLDAAEPTDAAGTATAE